MPAPPSSTHHHNPDPCPHRPAAPITAPERVSPRVSSGCSGDRMTPGGYLLLYTCGAAWDGGRRRRTKKKVQLDPSTLLAAAASHNCSRPVSQ